MFDVGESLRAGLASARERLEHAQSAVADANAGHGGRSTEAAMTETAQAAIFSEAVLNALHARLAEIKAVTRA